MLTGGWQSLPVHRNQYGVQGKRTPPTPEPAKDREYQGRRRATRIYDCAAGRYLICHSDKYRMYRLPITRMRDEGAHLGLRFPTPITRVKTDETIKFIFRLLINWPSSWLRVSIPQDLEKLNSLAEGGAEYEGGLLGLSENKPDKVATRGRKGT